jgi:hypothetical protein
MARIAANSCALSKILNTEMKDLGRKVMANE